MRVVVVGTRSFGRAAVAEIRKDHEVVLISSPHDDPLSGYAAAEGIPWTPKLTGEVTARASADVVVSAHSHQYLSGPVRAATRYGALVYHPSLLPRHRGKDAVRWTVHMRDSIAGGTVFWADRGVDTGPVAAQDWCFVDPVWDASTLWRERLFPMGLELIGRVLADLEAGIVRAVPQDERYATFEPSWERPPLHRPELPQIADTPYTGPRHRRR